MGNYPNVLFIDVMSINVEGAELSVLKTIDFQKFHFGLIRLKIVRKQKVRASVLKSLWTTRV
jgi:hypothetical protein